MLRQFSYILLPYGLLLSFLYLISCTDDDENAVINQPPLIEAQTFIAEENIADDAVIGTISATDTDEDTLTFSLIQNSDDLFELTDSGELSLAAGKTLDFEQVTSHDITVEVSDGTNTTSAGITITVENVVEPFVTTWQTTTANEEIMIRIGRGLTYNYTIDWGDGTVEENQTTAKSHTYANPGTYIVSISGLAPAIILRDSKQLQTIDQWGDNVWESMNSMFKFCQYMTYNAKDTPNLSNVTDMSSMFQYCEKFNADLSNWNVNNVTNMSQMFNKACSFNGDVSTWDVSKVTDMGHMFDRARSFNGDISTWDVSKVTNMRDMFDSASSFSGDVSAWDVSNVSNMSGMFNNNNISTTTYDKLLNAWAALPNLQSNVTLGAFGLKYCGGTRGRNTLVNDKGWTIFGDGVSPSCI